ncbi:membrane protein [Acrocarpospora pleiomorpha]|uniref:Membrane protein n=1 Tax=Acrocarpospora pleiomorpha TaxID=90975 RepID=A0A5M3Y2W2_9ACTN|nr:membrane protein [Acrocarpospora pleiomorpha]
MTSADTHWDGVSMASAEGAGESASASGRVPLSIWDITPRHVDVPPVGDVRRPRELTILYRGPLASCDYDCAYCPFAKRRDSPARLRADREALARFTGWVAAQDFPISVLFTPWGEALVRSWYRAAMVELSHLAHVARVAIQTNLSGRLNWLAGANLDTLALWVTYHPSQVTHDRFLARCRELLTRGVRFSVGVVGVPDQVEQARRLRAELPAEVYLWINAAESHVYSDQEAAIWTAIDPLFNYSRQPHRSFGLPCRTGETVVSVDGEGTVRRCHFVTQTIGNLYDGSALRALRPRPCPLPVCDCHIGYVHLEPLDLYRTFAGGLLERVPADWPC